MMTGMAMTVAGEDAEEAAVVVAGGTEDLAAEVEGTEREGVADGSRVNCLQQMFDFLTLMTPMFFTIYLRLKMLHSAGVLSNSNFSIY
jgi:hypothetical protein